MAGAWSSWSHCVCIQEAEGKGSKVILSQGPAPKGPTPFFSEVLPPKGSQPSEQHHQLGIKYRTLRLEGTFHIQNTTGREEGVLWLRKENVPGRKDSVMMDFLGKSSMVG